MPPYLDVEELAYGTPEGRPLVKSLNFSVMESEICLIKGPNGIGKTTLLDILSGKGKSTSGKIKWNVKKSEIFYLPQLHNREFHISLTLLDILKFSGHFSSDLLARTSEGLLTSSQLSHSWNTASGGERQKTLLIRAFLKNPKVLILDEPMNHLDASSRENFQDVLRNFVKKGRKSVIMVGHHTEDAWLDSKTIDLAEAMA